MCYAVVSYQTAYLKCHFPHAYMAALMTSVLDNAVKISGYIAECREMGIATLPPDINRSDDPFTVEGNAIRFGMGAIKNVGRGLIRSMVAKRTQDGEFRSLEDFLQRMGDEVSRRTVENFIKCGAMDGFGHHRSELLAVYDYMMNAVSASRKRNIDGQMDLFQLSQDTQAVPSVPIPSLPELDKAELRLMEKETTGIYLSGHPMDDFRPYLKKTRVVPIGRLLAEDCPYQDDQVVSVAGVVETVKMKTTRNNSIMCYVTVEDDTGGIEMLAFSRTIDQYGGYLRENEPVVITGKFSIRDDKDPQILINRVRPMSDFTTEMPPDEDANEVVPDGTLYLRLPSEQDPRFEKCKAILAMFPGNNPVVVYFSDTSVRRGSRCGLYKIMLRELYRLLGEDNVILR